MKFKYRSFNSHFVTLYVELLLAAVEDLETPIFLAKRETRGYMAS